MKNLLLLSVLFLVFTASKCKKGPSFKLDQNFSMKISDNMQCDCGDMTVQFVKVKEDSRCPKGVNCVWEGQAVIELAIDTKPLELTMRAGNEADRKKSMGNYTIELVKVDPYPEGENASIPQEDYVIELKVSEAEKM